MTTANERPTASAVAVPKRMLAPDPETSSNSACSADFRPPAAASAKRNTIGSRLESTSSKGFAIAIAAIAAADSEASASTGDAPAVPSTAAQATSHWWHCSPVPIPSRRSTSVNTEEFASSRSLMRSNSRWWFAMTSVRKSSRPERTASLIGSEAS